jgi:hypothetical protein
MLAVADSASSFKVVPPPKTRDMSPSQLPIAVRNLDSLATVMKAQLIAAFFEARVSPVMHRASEDNSPPPVPAPVVKPDGEVYEGDEHQLVRWYFVLRGYNVGVVQGSYVLHSCITSSLRLT